MATMVSYHDFASMGLNIGHRYVRVLVRTGRFPKPIKGRGIDVTANGGHHTKFYWRKSDIQNYIASRIAHD